MYKRISLMLLCAVLLVSMALPVCAEGEKTLTISTVEEFLAFAEGCRLDTYSENLQVSLEEDIDLTGVPFDGVPLFGGTFLGNGHTVSGLSIGASGSAQGLFRYLTATASVQALTVEGSVEPEGSRSQAGGIVGVNAGTVKDCTFRGTVTGTGRVGIIAGTNGVTGVIDGCTAEGEVYGDHFVGGIAGENYGVIRDCVNRALVNTTARQNTVDISDITLDSLLSAEAVNTVTDIGGIAGISSGVIRACENRGDVGYRQMGYNIGGIAGTQSGYITNCRNYASVQGRKEVGGIVGQMEPAAVIEYSEDTLQTLQAQLHTMSGLTSQAAGNAQANAAQLGNRLDTLQTQTQTARDAVDSLIPDADDPQLPDSDTVLAARNALSSTLGAMPDTIRGITSATESTVGGLYRDLLAVTEQMNAMQQTINQAEENLGGSFTDVSDQDTAETLTGKVALCANTGSILADRNAGGIAGAMAMENDLDTLEDWEQQGESSLNSESRVRAVLLSCRNSGTVTGNKQNAGGIVGWQALGLVKDSTNTGTVQAENADYAGGIAGLSSGYIRSCSAKCAVTGSAHVGGIAGMAAVVTDCRSLTDLAGTERVGGVLGYRGENYTDAEQPVLGNCYAVTDTDPGAVDGISYDALAQGLALEDFLALEGLPGLFRTATVTFDFGDGTQKTVTLTPGSSLAAEDIPPIPDTEGFAGVWEGLAEADLTSVCLDTTFRLIYIGRDTTLAAAEERDGRPVLLLQGDFAEDAAVTTAPADSAPVPEEKQTLLESLQFTCEGARQLTAARYLLAEGTDPEKLTVFVQASDGSWRTETCRISGSYLVVPLEAGDMGLALAQRQTPGIPWLWIAIGTAAAAAVAVTVWLRLRRRKRKQNAKP